MEVFLSYLIPGILTGIVYSLIALGFVLIYKTSGVLNFATGYFVILGAYVAWTFTVQLGFPDVWWRWPLALIMVIITTVLLGLLVERLALRPLIGQPVFSQIGMTLGLGVFLEGLITLFWGAEPKRLPRLFPEETLDFLGVAVSTVYLWTALFAIVLVAVLGIFFKYHRSGLAMRAAADDQQCVQTFAVSVKRVLQYSWVISAVVCAIAGILLSLITNLSLGLANMGLKTITVVLAGGMESMVGSLIAGPMIGAVEYVGAGYGDMYVGGGLKEIIAFFVLIIFMMVKPYGLLGWKKIERV